MQSATWSMSSKEKQEQHAKFRDNYRKLLISKWTGILDGFDEYDKEALIEYLIERNTHFCPSVNNKLIDRNSLNIRLCSCIKDLSNNFGKRTAGFNKVSK
jgi:hypothetical protein